MSGGPAPYAPGLSVRVRPAGDDDGDLGVIATVVNAVTPDDPTSIDEERWTDLTYPGGARFIAETDRGPVVGIAIVGRIHVYAPEFDGLWATVKVLPDARRQGTGSRLLAAVSEHARVRGKSALHIPVSVESPTSGWATGPFPTT